MSSFYVFTWHAYMFTHDKLKLTHEDLFLTHENIKEDHDFLTKSISKEETEIDESSSYELDG